MSRAWCCPSFPLAHPLPSLSSLPVWFLSRHSPTCTISAPPGPHSRIPRSSLDRVVYSFERKSRIPIRFLILFLFAPFNRSKTCSRYSKISFHALMSRALLQLRIGKSASVGRSRDSLVWLDFSHWVSRRRVNKGKSLINLIDPRRSLYLEILESRMRPCGVVNTVGGTRTTDRHLLPERTASLAGLSGKISIVSFCVTQVSSLFPFFFFGSKKKQQGTSKQRGKKEGTWCTVAGHSNSTSRFYFLLLCAINCRTCFPLWQMLRVSRCLI